MKILFTLLVPCLLIVGCARTGTVSGRPAPTDEMIAEWEAKSKPGPSHKLLEPLIGEFQTSVKFWTAPDAVPDVSNGSSSNAWILDGRYVREDFTGTMNGQSFTGLGIIGFDNFKNEFSSVWADSISTGIVVTFGQADLSGKEISFRGEVRDPMTGEQINTRSVYHVIDKNRHSFEMFEDSPESPEYKTLEIEYTRK